MNVKTFSIVTIARYPHVHSDVSFQVSEGLGYLPTTGLQPHLQGEMFGSLSLIIVLGVHGKINAT